MATIRGAGRLRRLRKRTRDTEAHRSGSAIVARTRLARQIAATDQRIDRLVYELYELTEAEIRIVEGD